MLPRPRLFAASTTLALAAGGVVVTKTRVPIHAFGSQALREKVGERARQATLAEAGWLAEARHPGVVRLRHVSPAQCRLETELAGRASLRALTLAPAPARAAVLDLAATLADLHRRGLVHGRIRPEHVVVDVSREGGVALCSPSGAEGDPAGDVRGLLGVIDHLQAGFERPNPDWSSTMDELRRRQSTVTIANVSDAIGALPPRVSRLGRIRSARRRR